MSKNVIVLIDGTGNEFVVDETNVLRLARHLVNDPAEQMFYYDPGVGTQGAPATDFTNRQELIKLMGLAIGTGVFEKIASAYRWLIDRYEPGDRIFLFGFSRGAYIARALAGLIGKLGFLERGRDNLVTHAVKVYAEPRNLPLTSNFSRTFCDRAGVIEFLGIWDTVKSFYRFEVMGPEITGVVLPRTFSNAAVRTMRHAVAIDERRRFYRTNLWNEVRPETPTTDVEEVWFAGVHCDVGGGYPRDEAGLADISFRWMLREAQAAGLKTKPVDVTATPNALRVSPASASMHPPVHVSLAGWWKLPEFFLKRVRLGRTGKRALRWYLPRGEPRFIPENALIHESVVARMNAGIGYAPVNLPKRHSIES